MEYNDLWIKIKGNIIQRNAKNKALYGWLAPTSFIKAERINGVLQLYIGVNGGRLAYQYLTNNLNNVIHEATDFVKEPFTIHLVQQAPAQQSFFQEEPNLEHLLDHTEPTKAPIPTQIINTEVKKPKFENFVNQDYSFNTFVIGKNNEFAHAATFNIAQNPGSAYNPLFICGPVGMGKTHLLHAAGNKIHELYPNLRIFYVSVDKLINDCVINLKNGSMEKFRKKYRDEVDILLVDDMQILRRGESVQEEFFHILNDMFNKKKQVIVASDRLPREIIGLEDRIKSRLEWGLIAKIEMPDIETRIAILRYKAEKSLVRLPEDVITHVARISKTSIRELEGNLNLLKIYSELQGLPIDLELAKRVLASQEYQNTATIEDIQKVVSDYYKMKLQDLKGTSRRKEIVRPRQVAMYLIEKHLGKSLTDIGKAFGGRDHTTVINARDRIKDQLSSNPDLNKEIDDLTTKIHNINGL